MKAYVAPLAAILLIIAIAVIRGPGSAEASFHCNRIAALMAGADGNSAVQYVELREAVAGQNLIGSNGTQLKFFDSAGNLTGSFTFPSNPANGAQGASILAATSAFASASNVVPDFIIPADVMAPAGKVQFVGPTNCNFTSTIIDSVAYGNYTGTVDCGTTPAVASSGLPTTGAQALVLNDLNTTCSSNATEYSQQQLPAPIPQSPPGPTSPRNNAGVSGFVTLTLTCSPSSVSAAQGGSASTACTLESAGGFNSPVSLSCAGQPAGVSCSFGPNPATPPANGSTMSNLMISVNGMVATGTYNFQVVGMSGGITRSATVQLMVTGITSPTPTATPAPTATPTPTPTPSATPSPSPTPMPTPSPTPAPGTHPCTRSDGVTVFVLWSTPTGDDDCDGFTTAIENFVGTNPLLACGTNAWPPDLNSDMRVNLTDVILLKPHFGFASPDPSYSARFDLNADNKVNLTDVIILKPFFGLSCTP